MNHSFSQWREYRPFLQRCIPAHIYDWLLDKSSLTARLQLRCDQFAVNVLSEHYRYASLYEADSLGIQSGIRLRVREVNLYCNNVAVVYARSLIPVTSLYGRLERLRFQGNKSLGAALFADSETIRGPIELIVTPAKAIPGATSGIIWGRRSLFHLSGYPLLVAEYYLPALFEEYNNEIAL